MSAASRIQEMNTQLWMVPPPPNMSGNLTRSWDVVGRTAILLLLAAIFVVSCVGQQPEADVAATSILTGDQPDKSSGSPVLFDDNDEDDDDDDEEYHDVQPSIDDAALPSRRPRPSPSRKPIRPSPSHKPIRPSPSRKPTKPSPSRKPHAPTPSPSHTPSPTSVGLAFRKLI